MSRDDYVPHSDEAEWHLLSALLGEGRFGSGRLPRDVRQGLAPEDFFDERHQRIYRAMVVLDDEEIPLLPQQIADRVGEDYVSKANCEQYLYRIFYGYAATSPEAKHYAKLLRMLSQQRAQLREGKRLMDEARALKAGGKTSGWKKRRRDDTA